MSKFKIQHELHSLAQIFEPLEFRGYTFKLWDDGFSDPFNNNKVLIEKELRAHSFDDAIIIFREELNAVVDRLSFITQSYMVYEHGSFAIWKHSPPDRSFVFRHIYPVNAVGLHLDNNEKACFEDIEGFQPPGDLFGFLREANNASTETTRFTMLIGALEAIAGETKDHKTRNFLTNKTFIKEKIIKDNELYNELYAYGTGLRNHIFHGRSVDLTPRSGSVYDINSELYQRIREYVIETYNININLNAISVPRNPFDNFNIWQGWLAPRDYKIRDKLPDLVRMSFNEFEGRTEFGEYLLSRYDITNA